MDPLVARMRPFGTTIFTEMSALAVRTGAVNLGQGFPDTDGPASMLDVAAEALHSGHNQYPPGPGIPALRRAIAEHQRDFWELEYDPDTEVVVTAGATEAIAAAILGLCEPGDEVVCFEPYYDSYAASIVLAGAVRRPGPLLSAVLRVKQFLTFVNAGPLQPAVAHALSLPRSYHRGFRAELQAKRDLLVAGLGEAGFSVFIPEGTYFVTVDITPLG